MGTQAKILADSISPAGARLTTFQLKFPRFLLAQFNTHRALSRNARSSRAVPTKALLDEVRAEPFIPRFRQNQKGMVAGELFGKGWQEDLGMQWHAGALQMTDLAEELAIRGVAKEIVNRLIEPWMWAYVVASATDWENFFAPRTALDAQPEFRELAEMMLSLMRASEPVERVWHLPYVTAAELGQHGKGTCFKLSVARCARVSYAPFDGNADIEAEIARAHKLAASGHWSPFEHQATSNELGNYPSGNFAGWAQYRKEFADECRRFEIGGAA